LEVQVAPDPLKGRVGSSWFMWLLKPGAEQ
jgi:hypothetical protein